VAARVREVIWTESARDALDEIITNIAQDSRQGAGHVLEAAIAAMTNAGGRFLRQRSAIVGCTQSLAP
jgi:hypothetical protein